MRLLLVEDDRLLAEGLVRQLGKAGFSVDTTPSAREAVVLGEQEDYRAVVLDFRVMLASGESKRIPIRCYFARNASKHPQKVLQTYRLDDIWCD